MINNRQNGRRRRGRTNTGGNRPDNGSRIDSRARGNAPQMLEKYRNMAREAQTQGDRVMTEYYLQFADHYFRIVAESRARYEETRQPRRDEWQSEDGYDGEEGETSESLVESDGEYSEDQNAERRPPQRRDRPNYRDRNDRGDRNERPERQERYERPERSGSDRQEQPDRQERSERPQRNEQQRDRAERPERVERPERAEHSENRPERRPRTSSPRTKMQPSENEPLTLDLAVLPPSIATDVPSAGVDDESAAPPKRRGRPKKVAEEAAE